MRNVTKIIIHCSDSDVAAHDNVATIEEWHLKRGFSSIGYHFVITKNAVEQGRPLEIQGAHTKGHNDDSIGICVTGRNGFSTKQMKMLEDTVRLLCMCFPTIKEVRPHHYYNKEKTCPNFSSSVFGEVK